MLTCGETNTVDQKREDPGEAPNIAGAKSQQSYSPICTMMWAHPTLDRTGRIKRLELQKSR